MVIGTQKHAFDNDVRSTIQFFLSKKHVFGKKSIGGTREVEKAENRQKICHASLMSCQCAKLSAAIRPEQRFCRIFFHVKASNLEPCETLFRSKNSDFAGFYEILFRCKNSDFAGFYEIPL